MKRNALYVSAILLIGSIVSCTNKTSKPDTAREAETKTEISTLPPVNPYLASGNYAVPHFNTALTNAFTNPVKKDNYQVYSGILKEVIPSLLPNITLNASIDNYYWLVGANAIYYLSTADGHFLPMARIGLSARDNEEKQQAAIQLFANRNYTTADSMKMALKDLLGDSANQPLPTNALSLVDKDNILYTVTQNKLLAVALSDQNSPAKGIEILQQLDLKNVLSKNDTPIGLQLLFDGNLLINSKTGAFCVISRDSMKVKSKIQITPAQKFFGSCAIDDKNGIYALSDSLIMKLTWNGTNLSINTTDGAWSYPISYDRDSLLLAKGGGILSSPSLMGFGDDPDHLVVIADGAKRANLLAFWRDEIPGDSSNVNKDRLAGKIPINCGNYSGNDSNFLQSSHPLAIWGYGAFFANSINGYAAPQTVLDFALLGSIVPCPKGIEKFEWDYKNDRWLSIWSEPEVRTSAMQPIISTKSKLILINSFDSESAVIGWQIQGLDWINGNLINQIIFSSNTQYGNGMNGFFQFLKDGDLIFNSIGGSYRIAFGDDKGINKAPRL